MALYVIITNCHKLWSYDHVSYKNIIEGSGIMMSYHMLMVCNIHYYNSKALELT